MISHSCRIAPVVLFGCFGIALAQHGSVMDTVHNLSVSGPGEIRATEETEVCKFCHIPHNAVAPVPLWSRALPQGQYEMPDVTFQGTTPPNQPDGSSRLCLSCHDGTLALGKIGNEPAEISMAGSDRLVSGQQGFLGTDLSGGHPISFVVKDPEIELDDESDMGLKPAASIRGDETIRLDAAGKMQCTTCHDPHSDRYFREGQIPRFWVEASVEAVCLGCHELR